MRPKLPKYVKAVRSKGKLYLYFDTGKRVNGKAVRVRLPEMDEREFWPSYSAHMGHRTRRETEGRSSVVVTVPHLITLYEKSKDYLDRSEGTRRVYDIQLRKIEKLLPTAPVAEITPQDVQLLVDGLADKPGAANLCLAVLSNLMRFAHRRGYRSGNPCEGVKSFKLGEHLAWPEHVLEAALTSDDARVRLLVHLLYFTAQRINDVLRLTWGDVGAEKISVYVSKGKKRMSIHMHEQLAAELARTPRRGLPIVAKEDGTPISDTTARDLLKSFAASHGVDRVPHGIRKNAVISLLEAGNSMVETAAVSGQSLGMVEHYAKQRDVERIGTAAVLRWQRNERTTFKRRKTGSENG